VAAIRAGSLSLAAGTPGSYTLRQLAADTGYTVCFTADDGTVLQDTVQVIQFTCAGAPALAGANWEPVGNRRITSGSTDTLTLAFTPNGVPLLGFADGSQAWRASVLKYENGAWSPLGALGFSPSTAQTPDLAIGSDGTPLVVFEDAADANKATVMRFNGATWETLGSAGFSSGTALMPSMAVGVDGTPYVVYQDGGTTGPATVMAYRNGWQLVGQAGFSAGPAATPKIVIASDGTPYVAFRDGTCGERLTVMRFSGASWSLVGSAGVSGGMARFPDPAFAPDGSLWVAYEDAANSYRLTVMRFDGATWQPVGPVGFTSESATVPKLAFSADGLAYVGFRSLPHGAKVMRFSGTAWVSVGDTLVPSESVFSAPVAFDPSGTPYVAYHDATGATYAPTVAKLVLPPVVSRVIGPAAGTYGVGNVLTFTIEFDRPVEVSGTPQIVVKLGATSVRADYQSGGGTKTLVFTYTIRSGDAAPDGVSLGSSIEANGGGIHSAAGFAAQLGLGSLQPTGGAIVETTAPVVATPQVVALGATWVTVSFQSSVAGTGYFVVLSGGDAPAPTADQLRAGQDSLGGAAYRTGSWPLQPNATATYTISNLTASTSYTICFASEHGTGVSHASFRTAPAPPLSAPAWTPVGDAGTFDTRAFGQTLAFARDGTPYVVYRGAGDLVRVLRYSAGAWSTVAGNSVGYGENTAAAFSPDGTLYVAYSDYDCGGRATVKKLVGDTWSVVGSAGFSVGSAKPRLAFGPDGAPYVACGTGSDVRLARFDGAEWKVVSVAVLENGYQPNAVALAFGFDGAAHIGYTVFNNADLGGVLRLDSGVWAAVGGTYATTDGPRSWNFSFSPGGIPTVGFVCGGNQGPGRVVAPRPAGGWQPVGGSDFAVSADNVSLAWGPDGNPWVAYGCWPNTGRVKRLAGQGWDFLEGGDTLVGQVAYPALAFAPDGTAYIAYTDAERLVVAKFVSTAPAPAITAPLDQVVTVGGNSSFTVAVSGTPAPDLQWQVSADGGGSWTNLADAGAYSGATTATLSITPATGGLRGYQYRCVATNTAGTATSAAATLTVNVVPAVTNQPASATVGYGSDASFTVAAAGVPTPALQWQESRDGGQTWSDLPASAPYSGVASATLVLTQPTVAMRGYQYRCKLSSSAGSVLSDPVVLTVNAVTPSITWNTPNDIDYGTPLSAAQLSASASVPGTFSYSPAAGAVLGPGRQTLSVTFTPTDSVNYTTATAQTTFYVLAVPPSVALQPTDGNVATGSNIVLGVAVSGSALEYQWYFDGAPIEGATAATLNLANIQASQAGRYKLVVTNPCGSVATNEVSVTVGSPRTLSSTDYLSVTTWAGIGPGSNDGFKSSARFWSPQAVAVDAAENVYVADTNNRTVRKITPDGTVTTIAGKAGEMAYVDGSASEARFREICGIAADADGNVFVVGDGALRKISSIGVVSTLASGPYDWRGLAIDSAGTLYATDYSNCTVAKITPGGQVAILAGGSRGSADGQGTAAQFSAPTAVAVDRVGNLYVADSSNRVVRKVTPTGMVSTVVTGLGSLSGVAVGTDGTLYVGKQGATRVMSISGGGAVNVFAGGTTSGSNDGVGSDAQFASAQALALAASGNLYVADSANNTVRRITPAGVVTTIAGAGSIGSTDSGHPTARFRTPAGMAVDSLGNVWIADRGNNSIRRLTGSTVTTIAGSTTGLSGCVDATGAAARFASPESVAVDAAGNVFVADTGNNRIRKITPAGVVSTFAGQDAAGGADGDRAVATFYSPKGIAFDRSGNLFVADTWNHTIRKITPGGTVSTIAGQAGASGSSDAVGAAARFSYPWDVAVDADGNVFVADSANQVIRKIAPDHTVTTVAGLAGASGSLDGTGDAARFHDPMGLAIDEAGQLFVADSSNNTIRVVLDSGEVRTVAGYAWLSSDGLTPLSAGFNDGAGATARFVAPRDVAVDRLGNVYVTDGNNVIRKAAPLAGPTLSWPTPAPVTYGTRLSETQLNATASVPGTFAYSHPLGFAFGAGENAVTVTFTPADTPSNLSVVCTRPVVVQKAPLSCTASDQTIYQGDPIPPVTLTYSGFVTGESAAYLDAVPVATTSATSSSPAGTYAIELSGGNARNYALTLKPGVLTILPARSAPTVTADPANVPVEPGASASFTVSVTGVPAPSYRWQVSSDRGVSWYDLGNTETYSGVLTATLNVSVASVSMDGLRYRCRVANDSGSATSNAAVLTVGLVPSISAQPQSGTVIEGGNACFTVGTSGTPAPTLQWQVSTDAGASWTNLASGGVYSGVATSTLNITGATAAMRGYQYRCAGTNALGSVLSNAATLTVNVLPSVGTQPVAQTVVGGGNVTFSVVVSGTPAPMLQWQVSSDGGINWAALTDGDVYSGVTTATLRLTGVTAGMRGYQYRCLATNSGGSVASSPAALTVNVLPVFETQPASQTIYTGAETTFTVSANGTPAPALRWYVSVDDGSNWTALDNGGAYAGVATTTLAVSGATLAMNGWKFRCIATNAAGYVASASAALSVYLQPQAPAFTVQPVSQAVVAHAGPVFTVAVTGAPAPTLQWQLSTDSGQNWTNLVDGADFRGVTAPRLETARSEVSMSGYRYRCVATNTVRSISSNEAVLTVSQIPWIAAYTDSHSVLPGASTSFSVSAILGTPTPTLRWQSSVDGVSWTDLADGGVYFGSATAELTLSGVGDELNGFYFRCVATNSVGSYRTPAARLNVSPNVAPWLINEPVDQPTVVGTNAQFVVRAGGTPAPTLQWQVSTDGGSNWTNLTDGGVYSGVTTATLNITGATAGMRGYRYRCVATNVAGGATSNAATLTVNVPPLITAQPVGRTVLSGGSAAFVVAVSGTPAPTLQWQVCFDTGDLWTNLADGDGLAGTKSTTLNLTGIEAGSDGRRFRCVATNAAGSATSDPATLTVAVLPSFTAQPSDCTPPGGSTDASFSVLVVGPPTPTLQWQVSTDGGATWSDLLDGGMYSGTKASSLNVTGASAAMRGFKYRCVAINAAGSVPSRAATLTINVRPSIGTDPVSAQVLSGENVSFTASIAGTPTPTVQWQVSTDRGATWNDLADGGVYGGVTTATLSITGATAEMRGYQFRCIATNAASTATSFAATLLVDLPPSIVTQPGLQSITVGGNASFTISANGTPAPLLQWQVSADNGSTWTNLANGGVYSGVTTTTLSISGATAEMYDYVFRCVASNHAGSAASNPGPLLLHIPPAFTTEPTAQTVSAGAGVSFSVQLNANSHPLLHWWMSTDGGVNWVYVPEAAPYSGWLSGTLTIASVGTEMNGYQFRCVATGENSVTVYSAAATLAVTAAPTFTVQPTSQSVVAGAWASFTVTAQGTPTPTLRWQVSSDGIAWADVTDNAVYFGASLGILTAKTTDLSLNGLRYRCVATNSVGTTESVAVSLTVIFPTSIVGTYFGSFGSGRGHWALRVGADGTGTFLAYLPDRAAAIVTPVTVGVDGTFAATFNEIAPQSNLQRRAAAVAVAGAGRRPAGLTTQTLTARIQGGSVGGQLATTGESFAGTKDETLGAAPAGYFAASTTGGGGTTYAIVAFSGQALVVTATTSSIDAAVGTVSPSGQVNAVSDNGGQVVATISASAQTIAAAVTPAGASTPVLFGASTGMAAPTIATHPTAQSVTVGTTAVFHMVPTGDSIALRWQASADGSTWTNLTDTNGYSGTTTHDLSIANTSSAMSGYRYRCFATNLGGNAITDAATLTVTAIPLPLGGIATHGLSVAGYTAGGTVTITNNVEYLGNPTGITWEILLPDGWSYVSSTGRADVQPAAGTTGTLDWTWNTPPPTPFTFSYTLSIPATASGSQQIAAIATLKGTTNVQLLVRSDPLVITRVFAFHSADTNQDWKLGLTELARVIELYNTRNGSARTGCYAVQEGSEDGFGPDPTRTAGAAVTLSRYHSADTDQNGRISLTELARVIELYNQRSGSTRTGQYHVQSGTEDGYAAGAQP
jgi:sugar lactone lactonase YvrE